MKEMIVYQSNDGRSYRTPEEAQFGDKVNGILSALGYTDLPPNMYQADKEKFVKAILEKFDIVPKAFPKA